MIEPLLRGPYRAYCATTPEDVDAAQALRARAFGLVQPRDIDGFDAQKHHILVRHQGSGDLLCLEAKSGEVAWQANTCTPHPTK